MNGFMGIAIETARGVGDGKVKKRDSLPFFLANQAGDGVFGERGR